MLYVHLFGLIKENKFIKNTHSKAFQNRYQCSGEICCLYLQSLCKNTPQAVKMEAVISFKMSATIYNRHGKLKKKTESQY